MQMTWPFFRSHESRRAMISHRPVPVSSCWNGIVIMDTAPFYATPPLQFRGIPDSLAASHLEGSESCLVHADHRLVSPATADHGVWLNPNVRVAYSTAAYATVASRSWLSPLQISLGLWQNRFRRWLTTVWIKESIVRRRVTAWMRQTRVPPEKQTYNIFADPEEGERVEPGWFCLVNEMQLLVKNGWRHA